MTETVKRRRRWPWLVLAAVLLLVGGWVAWRPRPLNAIERRLVGDWINMPPGGLHDHLLKPSVCVLSLNSDRTWTEDSSFDGGPVERIAIGRWEATDSTLFAYETRSWHRKLVLLIGGQTIDESWDLLPTEAQEGSELTIHRSGGTRYRRRN